MKCFSQHECACPAIEKLICPNILLQEGGGLFQCDQTFLRYCEYRFLYHMLLTDSLQKLFFSILSTSQKIK